MAITRILATVAPALIAGLLSIHAPAQARDARPGAPLSLLPTDQSSSRATRTAPASRAIERATSRTSRENTSARKATAQKSAAKKKRVTRKSTARKRTTARRTARRAAQRPETKTAEASDNVMRGADSITLIARLPWWRNDSMQTIRYSRGDELESKMLAAADAWVAQHETTGLDIAHGNHRLAKAELIAAYAADEIEIADAGEINQIDLLAVESSEPPQQTFLQSLIALLGGAVAAASAARFLFG
jgi:hypothetical protein